MLRLPGEALRHRARQQQCRGCGQRDLEACLDYGLMPASDAFVPAGQAEPPRHPLELAFCRHCYLLQILQTLPPGQLFGEDYVYCSSVSSSWLAQARDNARSLIERFGLGARHRVIELASNDGYLLQYFRDAGIPVLGVDPAPVPVAAARHKGIPTRQAFFTRALAEQLQAEGLTADLVVANNVLAHVADLHDFLAGVVTLLAPGGTLVAEVPSLLALLEGCALDTVYHEHLCYFSLLSLRAILARHGLYLNDVEPLSSHGGSLRLYASRERGETDAVREGLQRERAGGLEHPACYHAFAQRAIRAVDELARELRALALKGKRLAAYGAAAKGTILLNALGDDAGLLDYVVDRNPAKHGRRVPGVMLPIEPVEHLRRDVPDCLLLLCWNLEAEIVEQQAAYLRAGGSFLVPLPVPRMVGARAA